MKNIHVTEEILQAYLLKEIQDDTVAQHLAMCLKCQKGLEEYQFLIDSVQKIKSETFSFDVTTLAMKRIMLYEKKKSKKQELVFWGALMVLIITISSFSIPFIPKIIDVFHSKSIFTILFILGTGTSIMLFLLADLQKQYRLRERKIFENNLQPIL